MSVELGLSLFQERIYSGGGGKSNPITGLLRPWGFLEVEAPRFQDIIHMKVVRLLALRTGNFYPIRKYSWYSFLLQAESTPGL